MKHHRVGLILFTLLFILSFTGQIARADTDGSSGLVGLDNTFDSDGIVTTSIQGSDTGDIDGDDYGYGVAFQPDGKILVTGAYWDGDDGINGYYDLFVARYCQNGTLDNGSNCGSPAFGSNGITTLRISDLTNLSFKMAVMVLADGKILVGGNAKLTGNFDFFLARFTGTGAIDTSYGGGDGIFYYDNNSNDDYFKGFTLLPDGKILMGGYTDVPHTILFIQVNLDGSLDTSFNEDGISSFLINATDTTVNRFDVQPDGKIVVGGYLSPGISFVARLTSNGDLDTTFSAGDGSDGYYANDITPQNDGITAIAIQPDGKILAAAYAYVVSSPVNENIVLFRFNNDGSLDADFDGDSGDGNGMVTTQIIANTKNMPNDILLQTDGKFIVGGVAGDEYAKEQDFAILRYTTTGLLDTTFNSTGFITTNVSLNDNWGASTLTPDGKLVVAGHSGEYLYTDISLLRYLTGVSETGASAQADTGAFTQIGGSNIWAQFDTGHACTSGVITATKTLDYPGGSGSAGEMPFYWDLSSDCSGEFSLNMRFCYTDDELQSQLATETTLALYKYVGGWVNQSGTVDESLNCVEKNGITSLSSWTLTDPTETGGPTAIVIKSLTARTKETGLMQGTIVAGMLVILIAALVTFIVLRLRENEGRYPTRE